MIPDEPHLITSFRHGLIRMEKFMAGSTLLLLLLLVFGQVLARNFFDYSIPSADILSRYLVLYVTFFGATLAVESYKHIRIDVVAACMNPDIMQKLRPPLYLISAVICGVMCWAAMRFWYDDWQYVAEYERWSSILAIITPFGFGLLSIHFLLGALFTRPQADDTV
jgi:TRAP-type C4-dicarboxylate transport system permease small subunit